MRDPHRLAESALHWGLGALLPEGDLSLKNNNSVISFHIMKSCHSLDEVKRTQGLMEKFIGG